MLVKVLLFSYQVRLTWFLLETVCFGMAGLKTVGKGLETFLTMSAGNFGGRSLGTNGLRRSSSHGFIMFILSRKFFELLQNFIKGRGLKFHQDICLERVKSFGELFKHENFFYLIFKSEKRQNDLLICSVEMSQ